MTFDQGSEFRTVLGRRKSMYIGGGALVLILLVVLILMLA